MLSQSLVCYDLRLFSSNDVCHECKIKFIFIFFFLPDEMSFWEEQADDNPKSLKWALDMNKQNHRLLMKTKGYTVELCKICNELDKSVESIYNDLSLYVSSTAVESIELRDDSDVRKEQFHLVEFLRNCSQNGISE